MIKLSISMIINKIKGIFQIGNVKRLEEPKNDNCGPDINLSEKNISKVQERVSFNNRNTEETLKKLEDENQKLKQLIQIRNKELEEITILELEYALSIYKEEEKLLRRIIKNRLTELDKVTLNS